MNLPERLAMGAARTEIYRARGSLPIVSGLTSLIDHHDRERMGGPHALVLAPLIRQLRAAEQSQMGEVRVERNALIADRAHNIWPENREFLAVG